MDKYIVTMLGEKDHGKSTLIGNLLIATGSTTEERVKEARVKGKRWEPAYILDSFSEERENEMTIDTTRAELVYKGKMFELIDVPGHLELIKNMMSGASNGDFAILMVSIKKGEGFKPQTRRHLFISQMFGIKALAVAINKMDIAGYDQKAFEKAKGEVEAYLKSIKFDKPVFFVPVSAYNNENLVEKSANMKWYKGLPLFSLLMDFSKRYYKAAKSGDEGVRALVQDVVDTDGSKAMFCVMYNGTIKVGDAIRAEPNGAKATVRKLHLKGKSVSKASAHSNIALVLDKEVNAERGSLIYGSSVKPYRKGEFQGRIFVINGLKGGEKGLFIRTNNNDIPIKSMRILSTLSPTTGKAAKGGSTIATNDSAVVSIKLARDYPLERYAEHNELGRFAIYRGEEFVGVGIVE
ncbi:MAG TPA: GTP-binding protein [Candidatus Acidoferrales bacterium]|nr:GTP-binding protein [Candidatus Acidoferrales bacterium]